jgi:hypothetical protein
MNKALVGIAVAAAVLVGAMLLPGESDGGKPAGSQTKPAARSAVSANRSSEAVLSLAPGVRRMAATPVDNRLTPLMREFIASRDDKALYERLRVLSKPGGEELYVMGAILERCGKIAGRKDAFNGKRWHLGGDDARARFANYASVSAKDPARDKRIAAFERSHAPACEGFGDVGSTDAEIRALLQKAAAAGDPKARAWLLEREIMAPFTTPDGGVSLGRRGPGDMPTITDAQYAALREAIASNDPYVLMTAGRLLASTKNDFAIQAGPDQRPIDPRAFFDAWNLAACDAGADCGPNHATLLGGCAILGNCDAHDLREHLFFYSHSPQQSQLIAAYQSQIANAIRTGDWSYFTVVRGQGTGDSVFLFGGR